MTTTHDADEHADQRRDPGSAPVAGPAETAEATAPVEGRGTGASVAVTVALVVALWVVIVLALAVGQIVLNRNGVDFAFGSLPGIWDWVIGFALFMVTYALVRRRHPKKS